MTKKKVKKEFTKKQLFEFEMKYKSKLENFHGLLYKKFDINLETVINAINTGFYSHSEYSICYGALDSCFYKGRNIDLKEYYDFLDCYKEHINFYKVIVNNEGFLPDLKNFIRMFKDYIPKDKITWRSITFKFWGNNSDNIDDDFIREFKDLLNWDIVSHKYKFDEDFLSEMRHYVNWDKILKRKKNVPKQKIKERIYRQYLREYLEKYDDEE